MTEYPEVLDGPTRVYALTVRAAAIECNQAIEQARKIRDEKIREAFQTCELALSTQTPTEN